MKMKIDAGTIYGFAAVSLLTGAVVCTAPTELEEIKKRAEDIRKMLGNVTVVHANNNYFPHFPSGKWPFATSIDDLQMAAYQYASDFKPDSADDIDVESLLEILKTDEIENKYRLSIVKKDIMRTVLVPF